MDKKKVIENLKQVELYINKLQGLDYTQLQLLKSAIFRLHDTQDELKKSDWISVEKEHVPELRYDGSWDGILVCNKDKWIVPLSYAYHNDLEFTHWRRIDKLEV